MPARMCAGWKGHKVALLVLCLQYFFPLVAVCILEASTFPFFQQPALR